MKVDQLLAIDTHTHAEVSCWNPFDNYGEEYDRAADKYFRSSQRPTVEETFAYYRLPAAHHKHLKSTNLLERLLRCVPDCTIVLLVRPGKRSTVSQRVQREILRNDLAVGLTVLFALFLAIGVRGQVLRASKTVDLGIAR